VQFREKDKKKKQNRQTASVFVEDDQPKKKIKDMEKEKFEEIIIRNSTCMFEYGKGK
jgi:hypothetical protein